MPATLLGPRDPAQPLLTFLEGSDRVELSGSTTGNWIAKTANLLVDGYGGPERVGILLPLHWHAICFTLGAAATGATVVIADRAEQLAGCSLCFTSLEHAEAALDAGVEDVFVSSGNAMGAPVRGPLNPMLLDAAREIPGYGDHFAGPAGEGGFDVSGTTIRLAPHPSIGPADRVLCTGGLAAGFGVLGGILLAGGALILAPAPESLDLPAVVSTEGVTATLGLDLPGLLRLDEGERP